MTDGPRRPTARYDGYADWYDANLAPYVEAAGHDLLALLGRGPGRCLDLACGTARTCAALPTLAGRWSVMTTGEGRWTAGVLAGCAHAKVTTWSAGSTSLGTAGSVRPGHDRRADARHRGIGTHLVGVAVERARLVGCEWLHLDFEDEVAAFYFEACGFTPTPAGVIALR